MIQARGLHKRFGGVTAVEDATFCAPDGAITGLLGPNGAGKTTTLRMLYTLMAPDGGTALVDGHDVRTAPLEVRRRLGVLPDAKGLYPRFTAREHLAYWGRLYGLSGAALERRCDALVDLLDLRALQGRRCEGFSQGERMKVAIGRALVHGPQNVLLDEPSNGLDVMAVRALREVLLRLRDEGRCVVLSSHVMQEVALLCDRLVVVAHGRVVSEGSPAELRARTGKDSLEEAFVAAVGAGAGTGRAA
jgi:sodium transport system ATP-binding protein